MGGGGQRLMQELPTLLADWKEESVSKKIAKSGTAKTLYTFKLGKDDAAQLGTILAGAAQNSTVKAFLSSLTFSKTQAIKLYTTRRVRYFVLPMKGNAA